MAYKKIGELTYKHGATGTRLYRQWKAIKTRCKNPNAINYERYGGRGIKICELWDCDFLEFHKWALENGYNDKSTIDRINNDGNYEPSNCRLVTQSVNCCNKEVFKIGKTIPKGITKRKNSFIVRVKHNGIRKQVGATQRLFTAILMYNSHVTNNNLPHSLIDPQMWLKT